MLAQGQPDGGPAEADLVGDRDAGALCSANHRLICIWRAGS